MDTFVKDLVYAARGLRKNLGFATVAIITIIVGGLFVKESRHVKIWDEVGADAAPLGDESPVVGSPA